MDQQHALTRWPLWYLIHESQDHVLVGSQSSDQNKDNTYLSSIRQLFRLTLKLYTYVQEVPE